MRRKPALIGVCVGVVVSGVFAQTLAFEVASVKPNRLGLTSPQRMTNLPPGDRVSFTNVTARNLIQVAYAGVSDIIGGPDWMGGGPPSPNQERFDVNAKAETLSTHEQLVEMMQTLLAERFKLAIHTESRQRDVYALRLVKADGSWGPQLRRATTDCAAMRAAATNLAERQAAAAACGNIATGRPPLHLRGVPIGQLLVLSGGLERPIVDQTGLAGNFDIDLNWTPDSFRDANIDHSRFPEIDLNGPNVFTALQEQLGLKLVSEKDIQPVLVIDHIERPRAD